MFSCTASLNNSRELCHATLIYFDQSFSVITFRLATLLARVVSFRYRSKSIKTIGNAGSFLKRPAPCITPTTHTLKVRTRAAWLNGSANGMHMATVFPTTAPPRPPPPLARLFLSPYILGSGAFLSDGLCFAERRRQYNRGRIGFRRWRWGRGAETLRRGRNTCQQA